MAVPKLHLTYPRQYEDRQNILKWLFDWHWYGLGYTADIIPVPGKRMTRRQADISSRTLRSRSEATIWKLEQNYLRLFVENCEGLQCHVPTWRKHLTRPSTHINRTIRKSWIGHEFFINPANRGIRVSLYDVHWCTVSHQSLSCDQRLPRRKWPFLHKQYFQPSFRNITSYSDSVLPKFMMCQRCKISWFHW